MPDTTATTPAATSALGMTLDQMVAQAPALLKPIAQQYGPALLAMTAQEFWAWVQLAGTSGSEYDAMKSIDDKLVGADRNAQWAKLAQSWSDANAKNSANLALGQSAMAALLKGILSVAMIPLGAL